MIVPKNNIKEAYSFVYKGIQGTFWEDDEKIVTTFLRTRSEDYSEQEDALIELEIYADNKQKKMYITNFCSQALLGIMDAHKYLKDNWKFEGGEGKWQIDVRYYTPIKAVRSSLLPLVSILDIIK